MNQSCKSKNFKTKTSLVVYLFSGWLDQFHLILVEKEMHC